MLESRNEGRILLKNPVFASFRGSLDRINGCFGGQGQTSFFGRSIDDRVRPRLDVKRWVGSPGDDGPGLLTLSVHAGCDQPGIGWQTFCMQILNLPDDVGKDYDDS